MGHADHKSAAKDTTVRCAVVTVSDTRTAETDTSGGYIREALASAGHAVSAYRIVPDDPALITRLLPELAGVTDVIILNGGTGISRRDTTIEAVSSVFEKTIPGFGELFRMLSFDDIGPSAMLSRATAGVYQDTVVFSMPGSTGAVRLAMEKLVLPELSHFVWEILRQKA